VTSLVTSIVSSALIRDLTQKPSTLDYARFIFHIAVTAGSVSGYVDLVTVYFVIFQQKKNLIDDGKLKWYIKMFGEFLDNVKSFFRCTCLLNSEKTFE
jgi:hypothetical protein